MRDFSGGPVVKTLSGFIPGWGDNIPHASQPKEHKQQKPYHNKFNKDSTERPHLKKKNLNV